MTLAEIIKDYRAANNHQQDNWVLHCANLPLHLAIHDAATASLGNSGQKGDKHPHQHILTKATLLSFADSVAAQEQLLADATNFHELYEIVEAARVKGIRDLTIYDNTCRIAATKGMTPEVIYLHRGTQKGAEELLGQRIKAAFLKREQLPNEWQQSDLECWEVEDILCIYKGNFGAATRNASDCTEPSSPKTDAKRTCR